MIYCRLLPHGINRLSAQRKNENAEVMDPNANFTNMHNFNLPLSMRTIGKEPHQEDMLLADEGEGEERS